MITALVACELATATPGASATCRACGGAMIPKCGRVLVWHWAHASGADCDDWAERDTVWHRDWQALFPLEQTEVPMGRHRADAVADDGTVIEFQHSSLSMDEIEAREAHYGPSMIWVFDVARAVATDRFEPRHDQKRGIWTFRWKQAKKTLKACRARVVLDLGDGRVFLMRRIHADEAPVGGWGHMGTKEQLLQAALPGRSRGGG